MIDGQMDGQTDQNDFVGCCPTNIEHPKTEEEEIKMEKTTNPNKKKKHTHTHTHTQNKWVDKLKGQGL